MSDAATTPRIPWPMAVFLIVTGGIGWFSAFMLTLDKFKVLENPNADLDCNFSVLVQCGVNLGSAQGSAFGFPNPLIGLGGFVAPIAVGVAMLAGAQFARWFWIAFNLGVAGAFAFVIWLIAQSIFALNVLCPWCMIVWTVTIPLFWVLTFRNARDGVFGERFRRAGRALLMWVVPITVVCYLTVALLAQIQLDLFRRLTLG